MNYIYNVMINLQDKLLNFYEWEHEDNISIEGRIPIYLISNNDYINVVNMQIKLNKTFLHKLTLCKGMCIFTNRIDAVCVKFKNSGIIYKISKLTIMDEMDIIEEVNNKNKIKLDYVIINGSNNYNYVTRKEQKIINKINNFIHLNKHNKSIVDYLYYEWFNSNDCKDKYNELLKGINNHYTEKHDNIYKIINLMNYKNV